MVPEQLEDHLEMNIGRLDTYAKARAEVISYTEQKAAKIDDGGAAPMDLDTFKGNKGGKGKGGKGKEKYHNPDKDVVCHLCKKKGHRKSACWYAKENGGTGKPPEPKDPKAGAKGTKGKKGGKGKGGKGKGKAHSFEGEGEEEQEWPEGDGQDGEQAGDGDLGFLCVLGPSADSAPARHQPRQVRSVDLPSAQSPGRGPNLGRLHLLCQVGVKDGAPNYWCPCPGCKGQKKRFNEDAPTQHLWSKRNEPGRPSSCQFEAWDRESKSNNYVRPAMPDQGEESEEETVEVEETDKEEQRSPSAEESSGRGRGRDPRKGTPAKVEPEGNVTSHKYGSSSKKRSSSTSPSARKRKEPLRAATPAPSCHRTSSLTTPRRQGRLNLKTLRGSSKPPEPERPPQERRGRSRSPLQRPPVVKTKAKENPDKEAKEPEPSTEKYVPPQLCKVCGSPCEPPPLQGWAT